MRILKVGAVVFAGLGLVAITLESSARFLGIRIGGFDPFFSSFADNVGKTASLFLSSAVLYLMSRTFSLGREIDAIASTTRHESPQEEVRSTPTPSPSDSRAEFRSHSDEWDAVVPARDSVGPLISLDNVSKVYDLGPVKVPALREASLDVPHGSLVVVLGPSGSGKTTLLNLLGGIDRATSGKIRIGATEVTDLDDARLVEFRREKVGFVFQFFNLIPNLTAGENVALAAELVSNAVDVAKVLRAVGLGNRMDHFPAELSGGEQQRVAIARALVKNPPILLCDEPTGELDYATGVKILEILQGVAHRDGRAVIVVTHNAAIAEMADLVVRLRGGRVDQIVRNPDPVSPQTLRW